MRNGNETTQKYDFTTRKYDCSDLWGTAVIELQCYCIITFIFACDICDRNFPLEKYFTGQALICKQQNLNTILKPGANSDSPPLILMYLVKS